MADLLISTQPLPEVFVLDCPHFPDHRGDFTKLFHAEALLAQGIAFTPAELFLARSNAGLLRGMHFQVGEAAHKKLVTCIKEPVLDVGLDVNPKSHHINQPFAVELSVAKKTALLIGKGFAHGFLTLADDSWVLYYTSTVHYPSLNQGLLWSSIAFDLPSAKPLISERDGLHPSIQELG
jgi:dTDP-4-dehydrorhamnose 3,5-epimerase